MDGRRRGKAGRAIGEEGGEEESTSRQARRDKGSLFVAAEGGGREDDEISSPRSPSPDSPSLPLGVCVRSNPHAQ